ncbi:uroporphyrinogen-III synthase [Acinetobacter sp.]|uniref:uroporphyrinogen-III synthase n=1 Tax=Acinetobacter sp. TaxID=472 RepID=UPI0031D9BE89
MLLINTRPEARAQALSQTIRSLGVDVLDLPLLELTAVDYSPQLAALYQQLMLAQVIVVVSPSAAEIGLRYLAQSGLSIAQLAHIQWIAVGKSTAQLLENQGIKAFVPEVETSEGMLSLPILKQLSVTHVAFWRGEGGRQFMMQQLQQQGIKILNFILYVRQCPQATQQQFQQKIPDLIGTEKKIYVCMSSEASWLNWQKLCHNSPDILMKCDYLALGERLYHLILNTISPHGQYQVTQLTSLAPEKIYDYLLKQKGLA